MSIPALVRVLDEDPDLLDLAGLPDPAAARDAAVARAVSVPPGPWDPSESGAAGMRGYVGLLLLDGLMARSVKIDRLPCTELLGPGDVLRPWVPENVHGSVRVRASWEVMEPTRFALLDRRFLQAVSPWPEMIAAILDRAIRRSRSLAFHLAVCHLRRVDVRLLVTFWHYADRWGRVTPDGVVVSLPLTHRLLASIIGAQRPTVTTALSELQARGLIERRADALWLLRGDPPDELGEVRGQAFEEPDTAGLAEPGGR